MLTLLHYVAALRMLTLEALHVPRKNHIARERTRARLLRISPWRRERLAGIPRRWMADGRFLERQLWHAIVEELARFGAAVHTCARNEAELEKCLQKWEGMKLNVTGSACDVSLPAEREKLMERVASIFHGKLHILVS
ncbi:hypothetical protein GW17_00037169 [Ensete ventricosum]|nr:hypothetical protein GW17_00037169 [Ensete ventricosum]